MTRLISLYIFVTLATKLLWSHPAQGKEGRVRGGRNQVQTFQLSSFKQIHTNIYVIFMKSFVDALNATAVV